MADETPKQRAMSRRSERDVLIASLYSQGLPVIEIARRADVCVKTVRNVARRFGLAPRYQPQPSRDAAIVRRYGAGDPVTEIARDLGVSMPRVRFIAARAGLPPTSGWQRRYPINEGAFDEPTAVGWWLIGLLAADGSVHENRVTLCQTLDDADVLHAFYAYVGCPERPLTMLNLSVAARARQYPRRPAAEARIFSKRITQALARHGVVPGKTSTMELSREASTRAGVWLGLLDGDGSVGIYREGRQPRLLFAGTPQLMEQCRNFWRRALGFSTSRPAPRAHTGGIWTFSLCNGKAQAAAQILLDSSPVSMQRKRELLSHVAKWNPGGALCPGRRPTIVSGERRH
jgi:hypothetical protein